MLRVIKSVCTHSGLRLPAAPSRLKHWRCGSQNVVPAVDVDIFSAGFAVLAPLMLGQKRVAYTTDKACEGSMGDAHANGEGGQRRLLRGNNSGHTSNEVRETGRRLR